MDKTCSKIINIDFYLKLIPVLIFVFLIFNFIFNLGYFYTIGIKFASLLEMKDYYEGTAPLITLSVILFMCMFNVIIYSETLKNFSDYIKALFRTHCLSIRSHYKFYKILFFKYKKVDYQTKKEIAEIKRDLKAIGPIYKGNLLKDLFTLVFFIFIILNPFWQFYIWSYHLSKVIFYILLLLYLFVILFYLFSKSSIIKIASTIILIPCIIFVLGYWSFLRDYTFTGTKLITRQNISYLLVRPIAKGVIAKKEKEIIFLQWNDIKIIDKEFNGEFNANNK